MVFTVAQTAGATYPLGNLAVPSGQTASMDIAITAAIHEIGLYLNGPDDYIANYTPKGLGNCPGNTPTPPATSTPTATPIATPTATAQTPSGSDLPDTGSNVTVALTVGVLLTLVGAATVYVARRARAKA